MTSSENSRMLYFNQPRCAKMLWPKFKESMGGSPTETWYENTFPDGIVDFADVIVSEIAKTNSSVRGIRVITLDEEFLKFLTANSLEFDDESIRIYAGEMSDEKALELLRKNHLDVQYSVLFISTMVDPSPVNVPANDKKFSLCDRNRTLLWKYLGQIYGRENVYVPGCILRAEQCADFSVQNTLKQTSKKYFMQGENLRYDEIVTAEYKGEEPLAKGFVVYIPFVVRGITDHPMIISMDGAMGPSSLKDIPLYPNKIAFMKDVLSDFGLGTPDLNESRFGSLIFEDFDNGCEIYLRPIGLTGEEVLEDEKHFYEEILSNL